MLFCRENAFVAIYALFSDNKCPLFAHLGGGVAERGQCHLFLPFFLAQIYQGLKSLVNGLCTLTNWPQHVICVHTCMHCGLICGIWDWQFTIVRYLMKKERKL